MTRSRHVKRRPLYMQEQVESAWRNIPSDIGCLILDKLPEVVERIRFGAVCKSWNVISTEHQQLDTSCRNVLPMLLVPSPNAPAKRERPRIYAISCFGKYYSDIQLPLLFNRTRYYGSSYGWIVTHNRNYSVTLTYPFGREVQKIELPPLKESLAPYGIELYKLIISPDSTPDDYTVVAIYEDMKELATIKSGEKTWAFVSPQHGAKPASLFSDIMFYQGELYAASKYSQIVKVDVQARPPILKVIIPLIRSIQHRKVYLVESTFSELYFLQRCYGQGDSNPQKGLTIGFNVFKLILHGEKGELVDQKDFKNINGDTFFVGDNTSLAIRSSECLANSIYFMDDLHDPGYYKPDSPVDIGHFNVEDENIEYIYELNPAHTKNVARPIWIMPRQNH